MLGGGVKVYHELCGAALGGPRDGVKLDLRLRFRLVLESLRPGHAGRGG